MATAIVFVAAFAFFALFRFYGFQVEDEGTLLFQLSRVVHGQFPYVDFSTGYTPGFFYLGAAVLHGLGDSTTTLRPFLALVNAGSAAGLYALARRAVGPWMAAVPALLWVAFLPLYRDFAAFNVPYPAWFATLAWIGAALAMVRWMERGGLGVLMTAGLAAAFAFSVKPNAGAFALAAAVWIVTLASRRRAALDRAVGPLASLAMVGGVWLAFGMQWRTVDAAVHLVPAAVVGVLAATVLAGRYATEHHPRTSVALVTLALGFVPATLVWVVPVLARLGVAGFARDVLLLGSPAAALYYLAHPPPEFYAVAVVAGALGFALAGYAVARGWLPSAVPVVVAVAAVVVLAWRVWAGAIMPESVASSLSWQLLNAGFWLAPLAHWGGIAAVARAPREAPPAGESRFLAALVPLAVAMYLQLYPRTDDFHLVIAMPISVVLATTLLARVLGWWTHAPRLVGLPTRAVVHAALALVVATAVLARIAPAVQGWWLSRATPTLLVDSPTVGVRTDPGAADDLTGFGLATRFLTRHTTPGEPALAFPALTGLLFAADLTSPIPHDYWYPGRPDERDEEAMVETLRAAPPRFVVTLNDGWTFFYGAPAYFTRANAFVLEHYALVARCGRFDVLARRDFAPSIPFERFAPTGSGADVIEADLSRRRQAARRWMAGLTVEEATHPRFETDPRSAVLRLRAIRDGGDLRTAGWLLAGYGHANPRVRGEAVATMGWLATTFPATRYRWAHDFDVAAWRPYLEPFQDRMVALESASDARARDFARAVGELLIVPSVQE